MSNKKKPTQEERLLNLLRSRGGAGVRVFEMTMPRNMGGLGISQYNSRIWGLRQKGHNIKCVKPGLFVLEENEDVGVVENEELENGQCLFV